MFNVAGSSGVEGCKRLEFFRGSSGRCSLCDVVLGIEKLDVGGDAGKGKLGAHSRAVLVSAGVEGCRSVEVLRADCDVVSSKCKVRSIGDTVVVSGSGSIEGVEGCRRVESFRAGFVG